MNGVWGMSNQQLPEDTELHKAIMERNDDLFARLVKKPELINAQGVYERRPLHVAVMMKDFDKIRTLLSHGADWDIRDKMDNLPFETAVANGYTADELKQLLELRPTVRLDDGKRNALHVAAYSGREDLMPVLFDLGLDIEGRDMHGQSPLIVAVGEGKPAAAAALIDHDCSVLAQDDEGRNAIHIAIEQGDIDMVKLLMKHEGLSAALAQKTKSGCEQPLAMAASMGEFDIVRLLVEAGAMINIHEVDTRQPLRQAVYHSHPAIARYLIEKGADIGKYQESCTQSHSQLLVHSASITCQTDIYDELIRILVQSGVDIDHVDDKGQTALQRAASHQTLEHVKTLLKYGANVTMVDKELKSALDLAMPKQNYGHQQLTIDTVLALIAAGADPNMTLADNEALSPLHNAIKYGTAEIVEALLDKGADPNWRTIDKYAITPLLQAAGAGCSRSVELLLEKDISFFATTIKNETALHLAAQSGSAESIRMLLATGAYDINAENNDGLTPLHMAAAGNKAEAVSVLIEAGADLDRKNHKGEKPLHYAARRMDIHSVLEWFIARPDIATRVDWNEKSPAYGRTLLHAAVRYGRQSVIEHLLTLGCDPLLTNDYGMTPLHNAFLVSERAAIAVYLTRHMREHCGDALDKTTGPHGWRYVHYAAAVGHVQKFAGLLTAKADIHARTDEGDTPLHIAARRGHAKLIEYMATSKKADIFARNNKGDTPLATATKQGYQASMDALEKCTGELDADNIPQDPKPDSPPSQPGKPQQPRWGGDFL